MRAFYGEKDACVSIDQEWENEAIVKAFWVHPKLRRRGLGRSLMTQVINDADTERVKLLLEPVPFSQFDIEADVVHLPDMTPAQLRAFYRSFGFRMMPKPHENTMVRRPRRNQ